MLRRIFLTLITLVLLLVVAVGAAFFWAKSEVNSPGPLQAAITVLVPKGAGADAIARLLQERG
ncbi:MAG: hypothetical protein ABI439_09435, partial [Rhodospirillales bacterium]